MGDGGGVGGRMGGIRFGVLELRFWGLIVVGFIMVPTCMAKTRHSFSHDAKLKGGLGLGVGVGEGRGWDVSGGWGGVWGLFGGCPMVDMGFNKLPICMAKAMYSFSHDAKLEGGFWGGGLGESGGGLHLTAVGVGILLREGGGWVGWLGVNVGGGLHLHLL